MVAPSASIPSLAVSSCLSSYIGGITPGEQVRRYRRAYYTHGALTRLVPGYAPIVHTVKDLKVHVKVQVSQFRVPDIL